MMATSASVEDKANNRSFVNSKTMLRRRVRVNQIENCPTIDYQMSSMKHETIIPLTSNIYLPKDQAVNYEKLRDERETTNGGKKRVNSTTASCKSTEQVTPGQSSPEAKVDKIFSITTSVLFVIFITSLVGILCLCSTNGNTLLVDAHYSAVDQQVASENQRIKSIPSQTSQPPRLFQQQHQRQQIPSGDQVSNGIRQTLGSSSIDRFDDGEQIRPPLLRQPTTLPPITGGRDFNQQTGGTDSSSDSLQTADTAPDTYLSPEDREMFLKSQAEHYEGRGQDYVSPMGRNSNNGAELTAGSDGYESPSQGKWDGNGASGEVNPNQMSMSTGSSEQQQNGPPSPGGIEAAEEGDVDEDDMPEREERNLVPESRRTIVSGHGRQHQHNNNGLSDAASYNHQHQRQFNRPMTDQSQTGGGGNVASVDADGDPNDDYGGGNDDAYFSRKSINNGAGGGQNGGRGGGSNQLNLAASYNQQNSRNPMSDRQVHQQALDAGPRGSSGGGGYNEVLGSSNEESTGFGPGPNEAYMVDRAESGRGSSMPNEDDRADAGALDPSEGSGYGSGGGGDGGDDEMPKYDRRSSDDSNQAIDNLPNANGGNSNGNQNIDQNPNQDPDSDADEPSDSSEESAPSLSSSSPMDFRSLPRVNLPVNRPNNQQQQQVNANQSPSLPINSILMTPKTSASAPAPQSQSLKPANLSTTSGYVSPLPKVASRVRDAILQSNQIQANQQLPTLTTMRPPQVPGTQSAPHGLFSRQQVNPHQAQQLNVWNQHQQHQQQQYRATQAPYNPQNNPSHAGKYFIN